MSTISDRSSAIGPPTVEDLREGLRKTLGDGYEEAWRSMCSTLRIDPTASTLTDEEFDRLLDEVASHDRLCHVLSMSWRIRRTAARKLAELGR